MAAASGRVTISLAPPGGNALMMVIACEGKASCANAGVAASALAAVAMRKRRRSMRCPFEASPQTTLTRVFAHRGCPASHVQTSAQGQTDTGHQESVVVCPKADTTTSGSRHAPLAGPDSPL